MTKQNCTIQSKPKQVGRSRNSLTTDIFIARSNAIHGSKYCYKQTVYTASKNDVKIKCSIHGFFTQRASKHMAGQDCPHCSMSINPKKRLTKTEFIDRAKVAHGDIYDYSLVSYTNMKSKVEIICSIHGSFYQKAGGHINGKGCSECRGNNTPSKQEFVRRARAKHGDRYDYSKVYFSRIRDRATIICRKHGEFRQVVQSHLGGSGCQECSLPLRGHGRSDFKRTCKAINGGCGVLYAIKCFNDTEVFYKLGITAKSVKRRFPSTRSMPYQYREVFCIEGDADYIFNLEVKLHALLFSDRYEPEIHFGGHTECFTTIKPIEKLLKRLSTTEQLQLLA